MADSLAFGGGWGGRLERLGRLLNTGLGFAHIIKYLHGRVTDFNLSQWITIYSNQVLVKLAGYVAILMHSR